MILDFSVPCWQKMLEYCSSWMTVPIFTFLNFYCYSSGYVGEQVMCSLDSFPGKHVPRESMWWWRQTLHTLALLLVQGLMVASDVSKTELICLPKIRQSSFLLVLTIGCYVLLEWWSNSLALIVALNRMYVCMCMCRHAHKYLYTPHYGSITYTVYKF